MKKEFVQTQVCAQNVMYKQKAGPFCFPSSPDYKSAQFICFLFMEE